MELIQEMLQTIPISFLALITVINPLGTAFTLNTMSSGISTQDRKALALKIVINSLFIFFVVLGFGKYILQFFGISLPIIRIGGGLLLAVMGWNMLNSKNTKSDNQSSQDLGNTNFLDQSFYPFTFPVTVGPGCIAVIFTFSAHSSAEGHLMVELVRLVGSYIGLVGVAIVVYFSYVYSYVIEQKIGRAGAQALNRLMAFVTLCIGLEIVWTGIQTLLKISV